MCVWGGVATPIAVETFFDNHAKYGDGSHGSGSGFLFPTAPRERQLPKTNWHLRGTVGFLLVP